MTVTHVMADGTKRESVKGLVIPLNDITKEAYRISIRSAQKRDEDTVNHNEKKAG